MTKDSTSLACWGDCLAMASKVLAKAAMAVTGTPSLSAALRQTSERAIGAGWGGVGRSLVVGVATTIWAAGSKAGCGARGVDGLLAAWRLAGAIDGGDLVGVDEVESSAS